MTYMHLRVAAIGLATLTLADVASAQRSARSTGFVLGVHSVAAPGVSVTGNDIDGEFKTNFGMGAGVMVGYGFNETFSAYASLDIAKQKSGARDYDATFGLGHIEAGVRANMPLGSEITVPYVNASIGRRGIGANVYDTVLEREYDMSISGLSYGLGAGVERWFSPTMALDLGVSANFGKFDQYDGDGEEATADVNASRTIRMRIGVNWRPGSRRGS